MAKVRRSAANKPRVSKRGRSKASKKAKKNSVTRVKNTAKSPASVQTLTVRSKKVGRSINVQLKGMTVAQEPPADGNEADLLPNFRNRLDAALATLATAGTPFRLIEGFRTTARQQWLYGSGRPSVQPYGRPGAILTNDDGVQHLSKHQGSGAPGTGVAGDCYPTRNGSVYIPPASDPVWAAYAVAVEAQGLVAGYRWAKLKDCPHCELD